ncbi:hypothetical protein WH8501_18475 [Crocosphaera watsonii WH 8501]|uniref:Uncharacterized protein n=4 Tax=Crocosphaera watsonii TaxID=263511 RepID=G5J2A4_CROWT|nr:MULTISPECIES: hypothetical protein [Crocosphaera]EHJ13684.1 hypothetical protein CWATWH0003_1636 [Crocosphaera watsonii WH 0003]MCH2247072.1 hypothetical protein [Crocosphaera sp.]NQZ64455.1 hypothetical protein [Crocosphaera sp.]CCQ51516.1 FIG00557184: hypothetical protein [Crocosphaera watsonii WH 8502]CCQ53763.1 hypothetical protein CWATWH0005_2351 [Crocosphaera watsonii WH 0005]
MLSTDTERIIIFRNYLILMGTLAMLITGLGGMFENPDRLGQKDRLENYGRFVSGVVVNQAQKIGR